MMGTEARCVFTLGRTKAEGKALLETDELIFRGGDVRVSIPYTEISRVEAAEGTLRVTFPGGMARFAIGPAAEQWARKILNPPSRADKLGIKLGQRVLLVGVNDAELRLEIQTRGAVVTTRAATGVDAVFYAADDRAKLKRLGELRAHLKPNGAMWVVRPKGSLRISERDVMAAGKAAGLVDVKVVRFSATHTAEKFVIPVRFR